MTRTQRLVQIMGIYKSALLNIARTMTVGSRSFRIAITALNKGKSLEGNLNEKQSNEIQDQNQSEKTKREGQG